ncbi:MAG TPA: bifunctional phosphoribosyl-AMP cyclohydrolase/phosphoribosyl-ATP diphosphatase HisIE [Chitinophagaceae bacterium]|nr:bifunctional phosphoribosyl-AMP cyclohydrolase/phosphoribosyl-ATP diphosphatase HisIE [Chitinophagaceae bacterium]
MKIEFSKYKDGLVPVIIQDAATNVVLMLGFMNEIALQKTIETNLVTFFSRHKQRLWTKGETTGHYLHLVVMKPDCDNDTILIKVNPDGPVCHTGADTCFNEKNIAVNFLIELEQIIADRKERPNEKSYTSSLFKKGINAIAQKVGEEAVELVIESKDNDAGKFKNEAADLMFHYMILLKAKGFNLSDIVSTLKDRHSK